MSECLKIWKRASVELRRVLDTDSWERFLGDVVPVSLCRDERILTLGVANDFVSMWLTNNYREIVEEGVEAATGEAIGVRFVSGYDAPKRAIPAERSETKPKHVSKITDTQILRQERQRTIKLNIRPDFTFGNFVMGDSNRICVAAADAVSRMPGTAYNPLFIYGGSGLGKTHLLQAIANRVAADRPEAKIEYLSSEEFMNLYIDALSQGKVGAGNKGNVKFRNRFRNADLLLIDDVQFLKGKKATAEEFFHTFNTLYTSHTQIIIAADRAPHELELDDRLISRFDWGFSAEIEPPDYSTRLAILRKKQENQTVKLSDDVLALIAARITSNIRSLEGALTVLTMNVSALGCAMTVELAEQLLRNKFDAEVKKAVGIAAIQQRVAEQYDLKLSDILGKKRPRNIADARMIAMYLSRKLTDYSFPVIGDAFNRNHTTIVHAVDKIGGKIKSDDGFRLSVEAMERQLKG